MRCDRKRGAGHFGFTLIEVLVVVAILALLMAILLPSLQRARASARTGLCLSNLKQIAHGMTMYMADHRGWLPVGPADRVRYYDPHDYKYYDEPGPFRQIIPWGNCIWGGKRAAVIHDYKDPPRTETYKRPLTNYLYHGANLDSPALLFQCPSDTGIDQKFWALDRFQSESLYTVCGNSYYTNPWSYTPQTSTKRLRITSMLVLVEDAPMYFSIAHGEQLDGWHSRFSRHNLLFLDFHAANFYVDPRTYDPVLNARFESRRYQGPGWFAINYFEIMDYYKQ